ncbi:universal stress protein [Smaragdicoccus niigatensis]|uniref:universal stress protein n=1 Tax=Smaragdicoccus niigatensis TaxID=359359 RepID=UPI00036DBD53|nr:universal stress protein [Smaragdicoccus niigatensis]
MNFADSTSIVAGVDGSPTATRAALWAAGVAHDVNAPLVLASAFTIPGAYLTDATLLAEPLTTDAAAEAQEHLHEAEQAVLEKFPDLNVRLLRQQGPADLLLVALSEQAQLVVVGAHRTASLESLMVGTTAMLVANHAKSPVVVWRGACPPGPVVVGVDGGPLSITAIEHAFDYASRNRAPLLAIHAWDESRLMSADVDHAQHRLLLSESLAGWSEKYPDVTVKAISEPGDPRDVLADYAGRARLLVVGSHGRGRAAALILGSTSAHLLKHSPCPVMICRQSDS